MHLQTPHQGRIELHGWDSEEQAWHGPDEISFQLAGSRRLLSRLRELHGCWHGKIRAQGPGVPPLTFCAQIYDLGDAGLATLDMEGSPGGPLEIVLVVPAGRRHKLRQELPFEFASFVRFLGGPSPEGWELAVHDHVERALAETDPATTIVFAFETRMVPPEVHILVAGETEKLIMALIAWMAEEA